jgi:hypothetical protein
MADSIQQPKTSETRPLLPPNLVEVQERNASFLTRANEVMVDTARAVWKSEMELFQIESERVAKTLVPLKLGNDPTATVAAYSEQ